MKTLEKLYASINKLAMNRALLVVLICLAIPQSLCAETLYGLELSPLSKQEKHLNHFMKLFDDFCLGQKSQQAATQNVIASKRLQPAKDFEGVYEEHFEGLSYAVTPDSDVCTVDVLLEYQAGRLLFSPVAIQEEITKHTNYSHTKSITKAEQGPNSEIVLTIESHYQKNGAKVNEIVLTYPTNNQDVFYMTLDYHYEPSSGSAMEKSSQKFITFEKANRPNVEYFYSGSYFSKKNGNFESDFTQCHAYQLEYIKPDSEGYKVLRSLGESDQEIVSKGTIDCLYANDWKVYIEKNGELQELMFGYLYFKARNSMTSEEIEQSQLDLEERKEWYRKYAPDLISH